LAESNGFEVISADSRQFYRGMEIGTGQVSENWRRIVPHHFMGAFSPERPFSMYAFKKAVLKIVKEDQKKKYLIVGGTGLYIKSLMYAQREERQEIPLDIKIKIDQILKQQGAGALYSELTAADPAAAAGIHPHDAYRIAKALESCLATGRSYRSFKMMDVKSEHFARVPIIHLTLPRPLLYNRINRRIVEMMENGWVNEVKKLIRSGVSPNGNIFNALGYREIAAYIDGKLSKEASLLKIQKLTRKFAKKQMTFFRTQIPEALKVDGIKMEKLCRKFAWNWRNLVDGMSFIL
jgi:tRNA dimethylallyltransferase